VHDYEAVLEVSYQAHISPWWILQPDLQLIAHPGGSVAPPFQAPPARPIPSALVIGLRSSIIF
jgi:porin